MPSDRPDEGEDTRRDWEVIQEDAENHSKVERLKVRGGWLYRTSSDQGVAMVFVA
jgi:hypothetical protein